MARILPPRRPRRRGPHCDSTARHFWVNTSRRRSLTVQLDVLKFHGSSCPIPDDHIDPRQSAFFMAGSVLRECGGAENSPVDCFPAKRDGVRRC
jgi:hypothetical protein